MRQTITRCWDARRVASQGMPNRYLRPVTFAPRLPGWLSGRARSGTLPDVAGDRDRGGADGNARPRVQLPSPEVTQCPYPFYVALRDEAPIYKYPGRDEFLISPVCKDILEDPPAVRGCLLERGLARRTGAVSDVTSRRCCDLGEEMPRGADHDGLTPMSQTDTPRAHVGSAGVPRCGSSSRDRLQAAKPVVGAGSRTS